MCPLLLYAFALMNIIMVDRTAGLLIEPRYQVDLIEGLQLRNRTYRGLTVTEPGFQSFPSSPSSTPTPPSSAPAVFLSGDSRQLQLSSDFLNRATRILSEGNEFTLMASLRQDERNTGTILAFSEGNNRFLELQSSGRKDELRLYYSHRGTVLVETFPYRLADGSWHQLAVSVSGSHVDVFVDCSRIYKRVIHEVDCQMIGKNLTLWLGQRNPRHFLFKGSLQDVKIIGRAHGYVMQCPHVDTECPTCGQFRQLQVSVFHLENFIQHLTDRLAQAESRLAAVEECECQKSCYSNDTMHPDGATWRQDCEICSCKHGVIKCQNSQCPPTACKNPEHKIGDCCPTCLQRCRFDRAFYDHGEIVFPKECTQCKCNDGNMRCERIDKNKTCPVLTCPESDQFNVDGKCCPSCPGMDYCAQGHDCSTNATCVNLHTRYSCICDDGYKKVGKQCVDIDECLKEGGHEGHHCHSNTICTNMPGSYVCKCLAGYKRMDDYNCIENDECSTKEHKCDKNARCINTAGSYKCRCLEGYSGDGFTCQPLCTRACLNGGRCLSPGVCSCRLGYTGPGCETDVDECSRSLHQCHANSQCVNMPGWYYCRCNPGYQSTLSDNNMGILCQDLDECMTETHTCHSSATCVNDEGGYRCECLYNSTCSLACVDQGLTRKDGDSWHPDGQSCRTCSCNKGVTTCQNKPCDCGKVSDMDVSCCPQCDRTTYCHHQEAPVVFRNGEQWTYQCQTCECLYGEVDCWPMECPPVNCDNPILEPGSCCPVCDNDPCSTSSWNGTGEDGADPKGCTYLGKMYLSGERVPLTQDPCSSCKCKNGEICCSLVNGCLDSGRVSSGRRPKSRRSLRHKPFVEIPAHGGQEMSASSLQEPPNSTTPPKMEQSESDWENATGQVEVSYDIIGEDEASSHQVSEETKTHHSKDSCVSDASVNHDLFTLRGREPVGAVPNRNHQLLERLGAPILTSSETSAAAAKSLSSEDGRKGMAAPQSPVTAAPRRLFGHR